MHLAATDGAQNLDRSHRNRTLPQLAEMAAALQALSTDDPSEDVPCLSFPGVLIRSP
jgi:hypothetical protein